MSDELESALRWIATRRGARPFDLLAHAIEDPASDSAKQLAPLVGPTASLNRADTQSRALAAWGLIIDVINKIGSGRDSRRRNALAAAFRLPRRPEITAPWRSSLGDRFDQLKDLPGVFGNPRPTTTTPMHQAWKRALTGKVVPALRAELDTLTLDGAAWLTYVKMGRSIEEEIAREQAVRAEPEDPLLGYRSPSKGAQPVFLDLFTTTVFMRGRTVYRRITERLVTAKADYVDGYTARALQGDAGSPPNLPVMALWGCQAKPMEPRRGEPLLTKLVFPRALRRDQKHYFASETINEHLTEERLAVNVEVDHHGIAPGQLAYDYVPVSGLTIRICFDWNYPPEACWWYVEQTVRERYVKPADNEGRLLKIIGNTVQHTFTQKCHPRENYGIAFLWPAG